MKERMSDERLAEMTRWIAVDPDTPFDARFLEVRAALIAERTAYNELLAAAKAMLSDYCGDAPCFPYNGTNLTCRRCVVPRALRAIIDRDDTEPEVRA